MTIETKYNVGDEVWFLDQSLTPTRKFVKGVNIDIVHYNGIGAPIGGENHVSITYDIGIKQSQLGVTKMPETILFGSLDELNSIISHRIAHVLGILNSAKAAEERHKSNA